MSITNQYTPHNYHNCIDAYKNPEGEWLKCPCCGLYPKVWEFDNGRSTACGCWEDQYRHFSIHAESINSVHKRTGGTNMLEYDSGALRKNWNTWCETGKIVFEHTGKRDDGKC